MFSIRFCSFFKSKRFIICIISLFTILVIYLFVELISALVATLQPRNLLNVMKEMNCVPYTIPDSRPFFEREPPQKNLPRRISKKSEQDIIRQFQSLRLLVLATARDVEERIDVFRKSTEAIVDLFHPSSRILICESDSSDRTVEKLMKWPRAQLYTYGSISEIFPDRPDRIAFCRNKLLSLSRKITADYLLVVDVDLFAASLESFLSNFQYDIDQWTVMTASSSIYYDIWALRTLSDSVVNFDVWHRIWRIQDEETKYCKQSVADQYVGNNQKPLPLDHGLIEVRSAFNGAGIYKANWTRGCTYSGRNLTCEHVSFHRCIRKKHHGRIFINPRFLLG